MSIRSLFGLSGVLFALPMTAMQAAENAKHFSLEVEPSLAWQELRFLVAPFGFSQSGTLAGPVSFNGASFNAARPTDFTYRFNSYRAI